jgi:formylglycine-generating enzyme required for sulfatase activity
MTRGALILVLIAVAAGCDKSGAEGTAGPASAAKPTTFCDQLPPYAEAARKEMRRLHAVTKSFRDAAQTGPVEALTHGDKIRKSAEASKSEMEASAKKLRGIPAQPGEEAARNELSEIFDSLAKMNAAHTTTKGMDFMTLAQYLIRQELLVNQAYSSMLLSVDRVEKMCGVSKNSVLPDGMVLVPAGKFEMGTDDGGKTEKPVHKIALTSAFFIDRTEVTASAYQKCVAANFCIATKVHGPRVSEGEALRFGEHCNGPAGRGNHPINCVDKMQAIAYCAFVEKRLPTEAEWEYAARGTDGREHPWGKEEPTCELAVMSGCAGRARGTMPAGSLPDSKSPFGAVDMAGNVWEWVADTWDPGAYAKHEAKDPSVVSSGAEKGILRGGSWDFAASRTRSTYRLPFNKETGHVSTGFRCVRSSL